jgi:hypothetical protein
MEEAVEERGDRRRVTQLPHPEVVDDEQRDGGELGEEGLARAVERGIGQVFQQQMGLPVEHAMALENGGPAQRLGEMLLPVPGGPRKSTSSRC